MGEARGAGRPLFLDETEARRAENFFFLRPGPRDRVVRVVTQTTFKENYLFLRNSHMQPRDPLWSLLSNVFCFSCTLSLMLEFSALKELQTIWKHCEMPL